jgi:hypothetical protein
MGITVIADLPAITWNDLSVSQPWFGKSSLGVPLKVMGINI